MRHPSPAPPPAPVPAAALGRALASAAGGASYKATLERLLLELADDDADAAMLLLKEGRGAWLPLLAGEGGRALLVGDALSGTVTALATLGWRAVVLERSRERLAFARLRAADHTPGLADVVAGDGARLPFADGAFDLVVAEGGPGPALPDAAQLDELARVARDELVVVAANRLAYKRSTGQRGRFHVPSPLEWLARALRPAPGERTLAGHRRLVARRFGRVEAFALYPHAREFSHVVALDAPLPRLTVGPQERRNRLKLLAQRAGLFPLLTPSVALVGTRGAAARGVRRLDRALAEVGERLGEPAPEVEVLIATRSDQCVALCAPRDRAPGSEPSDAPGWWVVHVPTSPHEQGCLRRHHAALEELRARFPAVPVPAPLFEGRAAGMALGVERRLGGLNAAQLTGDRAATARTFADAARHLAELVVEREGLVDEARFASLVGERFERAAALCAVPSTARQVRALAERLRERLVGERLPLVRSHGDLRAKHVQVRPDGTVLGYLDWGAGDPLFLPYLDLLHLVAHQRKHEQGDDARAAWAALRDRAARRSHEREALEGYAARLGLPDDLPALLEEAYPAFVAAMAERHWDYSRPRWLHRQYGL